LIALRDIAGEACALMDASDPAARIDATVRRPLCIVFSILFDVTSIGHFDCGSTNVVPEAWFRGTFPRTATAGEKMCSKLKTRKWNMQKLR
jgi:hypothetical protein